MGRKSKIRLIGLVLLSVLFLTAAVSGAKFASYDEWLQWAEMGPYQPEVEDWDAIYEAAKGEPSLLIYSASSRIHPSISRMKEHFPGLQIETINISTPDLNERVLREWEAGLREVGVMHGAGLVDFHYDMLLPRNAVTNYVPRHLQESMAPIETEPMLRKLYVGTVWVYSTDIDDPDRTPWRNIWELTTEDWYGKVATWCPIEASNTREYYAALIQHSDKMEAMYEDFFGKSIKLTTPNAGLEFIKRLLDNGLRIFSDHRDVAEAVTSSQGNFAGLTTSSALRLVLDGVYEFKIDVETPMYTGYCTLFVGSFTESPNTAKLAVNWLMSPEGAAEWWGPNFPPYSIDVQVSEEWYTINDFKHPWEISIEDMHELSEIVVDYWMLWR